LGGDVRSWYPPQLMLLSFQPAKLNIVPARDLSSNGSVAGKDGAPYFGWEEANAS
jgi:hypothetical protein